MVDIFNPQKKQKSLKRSTLKSTLNEKGEYTDSEEVNEFKAITNSEPHYAKGYFQNRKQLQFVAKNYILLYIELSFYSVYNTNQVSLNTINRQNICDDLNIASSTLDNALTVLIKHQLITRISQGSYLLNPYQIGKGNWSENQKIRKAITYNIEHVDESNENSPIKAITFDFSLVPRFIKKHAALAKNEMINPDKPKRVKSETIKPSSSKKMGLFTKILNLIKRRKTVKNTKAYIDIDKTIPQKPQVPAEKPVSDLPH